MALNNSLNSPFPTAINKGGTGQTTAAAAFDALSPMTTLGDMIYGGASGTRTRVAGNTSATKMFLSQTGNGSVSAAPSWSAVSASDVGLGNVENTALSTWAGSTNIVTLGTITTGTVPFARLTGAQAALSGASLTAVTVASDDRVIIQDESDSGNIKTVTASQFLSGVTGFTEVTGTSQTMAVGGRYIANNGSLVTFTLPTTAAVGSTVQIEGSGAGMFTIAQNAGEQIHFGNVSSTAGTGGAVAATHRYDGITLLCIVANDTWKVVTSFGNFDVT